MGPYPEILVRLIFGIYTYSHHSKRGMRHHGHKSMDLNNINA